MFSRVHFLRPLVACVVVMAKRTQFAWKPPECSPVTKLKLYNSLTRQKEEFVPQDGKKVLWYSCGPTVYDSSHMGHARSYITFDILRRILVDYFGYDVFYVMNITDIDDKIIRRARQNHLFEQYKCKRLPISDILENVQELMQEYSEVIKSTTDPDKKSMQLRLMTQLESSIPVLESAVKTSDKSHSDAVVDEFLESAKDLLSAMLDIRYGSKIDDNAVFSAFPKHFEEEFYSDMDSLNILPPDVVTRVSEYIPEIIKYIAVIIDRGYAYASGGSVYFDVAKFDASPNHCYAKLRPEAYGDRDALNEGEGDLSVSDEILKEKRSPNDFALWKASRPGEPTWTSPWGMGRPGWHIECSVMASAICGSSLDIHTGGIDLQFPHHDNELAQAEAYFDNDHWVRYFLHSGHLTISGCKMSKSLKNFITIKDALKKHSSRQLRLLFLLHSWRERLDYSDDTIEIAKRYEKMISEFFLNVKDVLRSNKDGTQSKFFEKWTTDEISLNDRFQKSKVAIHEALCDNINTKGVMDELRDLITDCNIYLMRRRNERAAPNGPILKSVARYVMWMLDTFGAIERDEQIGFPLKNEQVTNAEDTLMPYLTALARFREDIRQKAVAARCPDVLKVCDELRDEVLPELGVKLEDKEAGFLPAIKLVDREVLLAEREERRKSDETKRLEKEKAKAERAAIQAERDRQRATPPQEMFRHETEKYSKFDEKGIPTHDKDGNEISKGQQSKLLKLYKTQEKRYQDYCNSQNTHSKSLPNGDS